MKVLRIRIPDEKTCLFSLNQNMLFKHSSDIKNKKKIVI